jgi:NADH:ubiquinone oxidoreductase subunit K
MVPIEHIMVFTGALFCIGVYGVMARRNAVLVLMAI